MTTSLLLFKSLFGFLSVGGCLAAGGFALHHSWTAPSLHSDHTPPKLHAIVLAHGSVSDSASDLTDINVDPDSQNYSCKLNAPAATPSKCQLTKLTITDKWIDLAGIKKATQTTKIAKADLSVTTNYFKLEVDESFYSSIELPTKKTIEIVSSSDSTKKFGTLNALFKFSGSEVEFEKTQHLLGKAETVTTAAVPPNTYQCPLKLAEEASDLGTCTFLAFGTTPASLSGAGYSNQKPTSLLPTPTTSTLTAHHYYLIQYTAELNKAKIGGSKVVQINQVNSSGSPSTYSKAGSFKDVVPVILDGTKGSQTAFILAETPNFSAVVTKATPVSTGKTVTHNQTQKNYKCKVGDATSVNCNLIPLLFTDAKTSMNLTDVKAAVIPSSGLSITSSASAANYFKVEVEESLFAKYKANLSTNPIHIVDVTAGVAGEPTMMTMTPLFALENDNDVYFDKALLIVSNATITNNGTMSPNNQRLCSFGPSAADATPKKCHITELPETIPANQNFAQSTPEPTSITTGKSYLVNYTEAPNTDGVEKTSGSKFFVQESASTTPNTKTDIANFPEANIDWAIVVDSSTSDKKNAFILKAS